MRTLSTKALCSTPLVQHLLSLGTLRILYYPETYATT